MLAIPQDYFIVELERVWEAEKKKSGIITLNEAYVDAKAKDDDTERNRYKRTWGTCISVPESFSDTSVTPIDMGAPAHGIYKGHDLIQERINEGFTDWNNSKYYPSLLDSWPFKTLADIAELVDVQPGERVIINPLALEPGNMIGTNRSQNRPIFKVRVDDIIGAGKPLRGQGGWVWVEPVMETEDEIRTIGGIFMKPMPGYKNLRGTMAAGPNAGSRVMFQTNSEWPFDLDGRKLYCMEEENVLCVIDEAVAKSSQ